MVMSEGDIDQTFADVAKKPPDAVVASYQLLFEDRRITDGHACHVLPSAGGDFFRALLLRGQGYYPSYGSDFEHQNVAGIYVGRILKGEKPADMRVLRPKKAEFVINRQTAQILGITLAPALLALADEVIK